jgi:peptidoglycan-associated lipoprotein
MKTTRLAWAAIAAVALIFSGCTSPEKREGGDGAQVVEGGAGARTAGIGAAGAWQGSPLDNPDSLLATRKIYFDFDRSEIRSEFVAILRAHADYLSANRSATVTIEGHCDERGSREYNIGLGERRASAIQRFLEAEGVDHTQINTISYGEERPQNPGHNESAWALNRRGVLVY